MDEQTRRIAYNAKGKVGQFIARREPSDLLIFIPVIGMIAVAVFAGPLPAPSTKAVPASLAFYNVGGVVDCTPGNVTAYNFTLRGVSRQGEGVAQPKAYGDFAEMVKEYCANEKRL
jgi:hypothetical protein